MIRFFEKCKKTYPPEFELRKGSTSNKTAPFHATNTEIKDNKSVNQLWDKRNFFSIWNSNNVLSKIFFSFIGPEILDLARTAN